MTDPIYQNQENIDKYGITDTYPFTTDIIAIKPNVISKYAGLSEGVSLTANNFVLGQSSIIALVNCFGRCCSISNWGPLHVLITIGAFLAIVGIAILTGGVGLVVGIALVTTFVAIYVGSAVIIGLTSFSIGTATADVKKMGILEIITLYRKAFAEDDPLDDIEKDLGIPQDIAKYIMDTNPNNVIIEIKTKRDIGISLTGNIKYYRTQDYVTENFGGNYEEMTDFFLKFNPETSNSDDLIKYCKLYKIGKVISGNTTNTIGIKLNRTWKWQGGTGCGKHQENDDMKETKGPVMAMSTQFYDYYYFIHWLRQPNRLRSSYDYTIDITHADGRPELAGNTYNFGLRPIENALSDDDLTGYKGNIVRYQFIPEINYNSILYMGGNIPITDLQIGGLCINRSNYATTDGQSVGEIPLLENASTEVKDILFGKLYTRNNLPPLLSESYRMMTKKDVEYINAFVEYVYQFCDDMKEYYGFYYCSDVFWKEKDGYDSMQLCLRPNFNDTSRLWIIDENQDKLIFTATPEDYSINPSTSDDDIAGIRFIGNSIYIGYDLSTCTLIGSQRWSKKIISCKLLEARKKCEEYQKEIKIASVRIPSLLDWYTLFCFINYGEGKSDPGNMFDSPFPIPEKYKITIPDGDYHTSSIQGDMHYYITINNNKVYVKLVEFATIKDRNLSLMMLLMTSSELFNEEELYFR